MTNPLTVHGGNLNSRLAFALLFFFVRLMAMADPIDVYSSLTGKTVLMPGRLPFLPASIVSDLPAETNKAIARLENEFLKLGVEVVQDGPHFVRIFPESERGLQTNAPLRGAVLTAEKSGQATPAGEMNFPGTDQNRVLQIYAGLSQRTVLRPVVLPMVQIRLQSICPLTCEEAIYAIETDLALNGIAVVEDDERFAEVMPVGFPPYMVSHAPERKPDAKLLDPNRLPSIGVPTPFQPPSSKLEQDLEQWQRDVYDFLHYKAPPDRPTQRLLELYARLVGKTAGPADTYGRLPVWFHIETPLSKDELEYAIQTTFKLNNFVIIPEGGQKIRLGRLGESDTGNPAANLQPTR